MRVKQGETDKGSHGNRIGRFCPSWSLGNINFQCIVIKWKSRVGFFPVREDKTQLERERGRWPEGAKPEGGFWPFRFPGFTL